MSPLALLLHVGQPFKSWHLFFYLNPTSPITWGFFLTLYPIHTVIYGIYMFRGNSKMTRLFETIGIPLAVFVHGYTGFILALGKARALWNTALMPFLFLVSAMVVSGIALMILISIVKKGLHDQAFLTRWTNVSMPQLVDHLSAFTPERAETESGVRAADIRRIAESFAQAKPAATITGRGVGGHQNGTLNERCIALLNAVAGSIDIPGGCCLPRTMDLESPRLKSPFPSSSQALAALKEGKAKAEMFFCYMANPAYANPGVAEGIQLLKD